MKRLMEEAIYGEWLTLWEAIFRRRQFMNSSSAILVCLSLPFLPIECETWAQYPASGPISPGPFFSFCSRIPLRLSWSCVSDQIRSVICIAILFESLVAEDPSGATVCTTQWNKIQSCYTSCIRSDPHGCKPFLWKLLVKGMCLLLFRQHNIQDV